MNSYLGIHLLPYNFICTFHGTHSYFFSFTECVPGLPMHDNIPMCFQHPEPIFSSVQQCLPEIRRGKNIINTILMQSFLLCRHHVMSHHILPHLELTMTWMHGPISKGQFFIPQGRRWGVEWVKWGPNPRLINLSLPVSSLLDDLLDTKYWVCPENTAHVLWMII